MFFTGAALPAGFCLFAASFLLLIPHISAESHGEVSKMPATCKQRLDTILTTYYSLNSTEFDGKNPYNVSCAGQCRVDCRKTIEVALNTEISSQCPRPDDIRTCFQIAYGDWTVLVTSCELFSGTGVSCAPEVAGAEAEGLDVAKPCKAPPPPPPLNYEGEAAPGRRLASTWQTGGVIRQLPKLLPSRRRLASAEEEAEAEAAGIHAPAPSPGAPLGIVETESEAPQPSKAEAEAEALAPGSALPSLRSAGAPEAEAEGLPPVRSATPPEAGAEAESNAPSASPRVRSASAPEAEAEGLAPVRSATAPEAEAEGVAHAPSVLAPAGQAKAEEKATAAVVKSAPVQAPAPLVEVEREYQGNGCFPDFHGLQDFKLWLSGWLVIGQPVETSTKPNVVGMVSIVISTAGFLSLAFM